MIAVIIVQKTYRDVDVTTSSPDFHFSCILTVFRGPREQIGNLGHHKISADTSV